MEKPRKKEWPKSMSSGWAEGWNDCHDAMSTWIEGEIPSLIEEIESIIIERLGSIEDEDKPDGNGGYEKLFSDRGEFQAKLISEKITALLTQRLGVVK